MKKVAIFMSDFHLGQNDQMEEFHTDNEFAELLGRLSFVHADDEVDLVLLGDVIDLWAAINAVERNAATPKDVDLYLPVDDPLAIPTAIDKEIDKTRAITSSHPTFFEALGRFVARNPERRRVLYVPGNHDHSVVEPTIQRLIRQQILTKEVRDIFQTHYPKLDQSVLEGNIQFQNFYENPDLKVYAEHGNQLTYGGAFRYWDTTKAESTFGTFGAECPGYVEFKLVSSRVERCAPELNGLLLGAFNPANWPGLFWWLLFRGKFLTLGRLQDFLIQYKHDNRSQAKWARKETPAAWKTVLYLMKTRMFGATRDEFNDQLAQLFDEKGTGMVPLSGKRLDPHKINTIVLGHSHQSRDVALPGLPGVRYYNTGSWILRYENTRRIVEQTWVSISRDLPVTLQSISHLTLTIEDKFGTRQELEVSNGEILREMKTGDRIFLEKDSQGKVRNILPDPLPRTIIDRQINRRRVELAEGTNSPITTDGRDLNPVLRSMDNLHVGDIMLFHWSFGTELWRLLKKGQLAEFLRVIPGMITGAVNRFGTSSYWNHVAVVFGSPSEREEADEYNDPLIIEALPDAGVSIHTPQHYLNHPQDWNFAVLRLKGALLDKWENRNLLRRLTLSNLEAHYDFETIKRETLIYTAKAMDAKGGAVLSGLVKGAIGGVLVCTLVLGSLVGITAYQHRHQWWLDLEQGLQTVTTWFKTMWGKEFAQQAMPDVVSWIYLSIKGLALLILLGLALYLIVNFVRIIKNAWIGVTATAGAIYGAAIIPAMADVAEGWANKSPAWRWGFTIIWFLPVLVILPCGNYLLFVKVSPVQGEGLSLEYILKANIILILLSALVTVWLAMPLTKMADPMIQQIAKKLWKLREIKKWVYAKLGWLVPSKSSCGAYPLHERFICSGLAQAALVDVAREVGTVEHVQEKDVIVNEQWKPQPQMSRAEQECLIRDTLPKQFALSDKFRWTYLYINGVLTPDPSASSKAQAYSAPINPSRGKLSRWASLSMQLALTGVVLTILVAFGTNQITDDLLKQIDSGIAGTFKHQLREVSLLVAGALGLGAFFCARVAQYVLALNPAMRGRALRLYGKVLGLLTVLVAYINLKLTQ